MPSEITLIDHFEWISASVIRSTEKKHLHYTAVPFNDGDIIVYGKSDFDWVDFVIIILIWALKYQNLKEDYAY